MLTWLISSRPFKLLYLAYSWVVVCSVWFVGYLFAMVASVGSRRKDEIYNTFCRASAWLIVRGIGVKVRVEGRENVPKGEPLIFICNHQSHFDIKLAFAFVPRNFCFVSKEEITKIPIVSGYMKTAGHIGMPREEDRKAYAVLLEIVKRAREGKSLLVFPEGTRSPDGRLGPFKRGIANIVLKAGRRVVPMAIIGSREFLPKGSWLCHPEHREMTVRFGKPLRFQCMERIPREESLAVLEELRQEVRKLLGEAVSALGGPGVPVVAPLASVVAPLASVMAPLASEVAPQASVAPPAPSVAPQAHQDEPVKGKVSREEVCG